MLSHTQASLKYHPGGIGEIVHSAKFEQILKQKAAVERRDIYEMFEDFEKYEALAQLNYALAEADQSLLEMHEHPFYRDIFKKVLYKQPDLICLLTWCWGTAAFFGIGIHRICPIVAKLYAFQEKERVILPLYEKSTLLLTESLLANQRGIFYGIPPSKILYIPHQFPREIEKIKPDLSYIERLAKKNGKILPSKPLVIIGMIGNFEPRKNFGYVLNALAKLAARGLLFLLIWKGTWSLSPFPKEIEILKEQPWFLWDSDPTPFPRVLREYATFDLCVQLSGYEGASNVVVELLALGKPVLVLDGTTNPYLFKEGAFFVKRQEELKGIGMPYQVPDEAHLEETLEMFIKDKSLRETWGRKGKQVAFKRFHPDEASNRLSLLMKSAQGINVKEEIETLYHKDYENYGLD